MCVWEREGVCVCVRDGAEEEEEEEEEEEKREEGDQQIILEKEWKWLKLRFDRAPTRGPQQKIDVTNSEKNRSRAKIK